MSERAREALAKLDAKLADLERVARETSDDDWRARCPAEGWPVGLVAYHIARGFQRQADFVEAARDGTGPHRFDWGVTHALNANVAAENASPTPNDVVVLGRSSVERMRAALESMPDEVLARIAFVYENGSRDILWVVGSLAVRHARGHLESIAATLGR